MIIWVVLSILVIIILLNPSGVLTWFTLVMGNFFDDTSDFAIFVFGLLEMKFPSFGTILGWLIIAFIVSIITSCLVDLVLLPEDANQIFLVLVIEFLVYFYILGVLLPFLSMDPAHFAKVFP